VHTVCIAFEMETLMVQKVTSVLMRSIAAIIGFAFGIATFMFFDGTSIIFRLIAAIFVGSVVESVSWHVLFGRNRR